MSGISYKNIESIDYQCMRDEYNFERRAHRYRAHQGDQYHHHSVRGGAMLPAPCQAPRAPGPDMPGHAVWLGIWRAARLAAALCARLPPAPAHHPWLLACGNAWLQPFNSGPLRWPQTPATGKATLQAARGTGTIFNPVSGEWKTVTGTGPGTLSATRPGRQARLPPRVARRAQQLPGVRAAHCCCLSFQGRPSIASHSPQISGSLALQRAIRDLEGGAAWLGHPATGRRHCRARQVRPHQVSESGTPGGSCAQRSLCCWVHVHVSAPGQQLRAGIR